ncbi:MAG: hypothetical protein SFW64_00085 [Alphaproteobacteria bacterium]|nr:hypothetical protein [Alphaproteobacteria bacterium]
MTKIVLPGFPHTKERIKELAQKNWPFHFSAQTDLDEKEIVHD